MTRIHIVGASPRVGSTLLFEVLKTCYDLECSPQHEESLVGRPSRPVDAYLSKYPLDALRVEPSIHVDHNLYIIFLIRDPRDVICSRHGKDKENYWVGLKYWNLFFPVYQRLRDHSRFVPLRYEKFVEEPDAVQESLEAVLPVGDRQHQFSNYHDHVQPSTDSGDALGEVRPISGASVGRWKSHRPRVAGQIELHRSISEDLRTLGYEQNEEWTSILSGVDPCFGKTHYEEFATEEEISSLRKGRYRESAKRLLENLIGKRIPRQ